MIDFCKMIWEDITGKLKPWVKYSYGIIAFIVVMACMGIVIPVILAIWPLIWVEGKILPHIKRFFKWAFFKEIKKEGDT
jgi:hypothetical protein